MRVARTICPFNRSTLKTIGRTIRTHNILYCYDITLYHRYRRHSLFRQPRSGNNEEINFPRILFSMEWRRRRREKTHRPSEEHPIGREVRIAEYAFVYHFSRLY